MLRPDRHIASVYLHRAPIDMRRQIDGLSALVVGVMQHNPLSGCLFVFINKQRNKLKILMWEKKRLCAVVQTLGATEIPMAVAIKRSGRDADRRAIELVVGRL